MPHHTQNSQIAQISHCHMKNNSELYTCTTASLYKPTSQSSNQPSNLLPIPYNMHKYIYYYDNIQTIIIIILELGGGFIINNTLLLVTEYLRSSNIIMVNILPSWRKADEDRDNIKCSSC